VGFNIPSDTVWSFQGWPLQAKNTQTHSNGTVSLTFTETQNTKKRAKPKT